MFTSKEDNQPTQLPLAVRPKPATPPGRLSGTRSDLGLRRILKNGVFRDAPSPSSSSFHQLKSFFRGTSSDGFVPYPAGLDHSRYLERNFPFFLVSQLRAISFRFFPFWFLRSLLAARFCAIPHALTAPRKISCLAFKAFSKILLQKDITKKTFFCFLVAFLFPLSCAPRHIPLVGP